MQHKFGSADVSGGMYGEFPHSQGNAGFLGSQE